MEKLLRRISGHEGLVLAAIPFIGTYVAFVFEVGYLSFYDAPISFIKIDFSRIVSATAGVIAIGSWFYIASIIIAAVGKGGHPLGNAFIKPLFYTLFFGIIFYLIPLPPEKWWGFLILSISLLVLEFVPPIFTKHHQGSYLEALSKQLEEDSSGKSSNKLKLKDVFGIILLCSFFALLSGRFYASEKNSYWSPIGHPNMIVVEIYGDIVLLKNIDPNSSQIGSKLEIVNISSTSNMKLNKIQLGQRKSGTDAHAVNKNP